MELPGLNLSTRPLLTLPARLQISSNNITYRIDLLPLFEAYESH